MPHTLHIHILLFGCVCCFEFFFVVCVYVLFLHQKNLTILKYIYTQTHIRRLRICVCELDICNFNLYFGKKETLIVRLIKVNTIFQYSIFFLFFCCRFCAFNVFLRLVVLVRTTQYDKENEKVNARNEMLKKSRDVAKKSLQQKKCFDSFFLSFSLSWISFCQMHEIAVQNFRSANISYESVIIWRNDRNNWNWPWNACIYEREHTHSLHCRTNFLFLIFFLSTNVCIVCVRVCTNPSFFNFPMGYSVRVCASVCLCVLCAFFLLW